MNLESGKSPSNPQINLNLDEFDIDSYDFKPVTKGLGFHGKEESKPNYKVNRERSSLEKPRQVKQRLTKEYLQDTPSTQVSMSTNSNMMSGLDAIYKRDDVSSSAYSNQVNEKKKVTKKKKYVEADFGDLLSAFLIDFFFISFFTISLFITFYTLAFQYISGEHFKEFLISSSLFIGLMFSLSYLTYFSILEPLGTLGKRAMGLFSFSHGIREHVTIRQAFIRSFICLASAPLLFIPLMLDFQGKLSDTGVFKKS